jgi:putative ABC transport system substrate-binding protein
MNRRAAIWHLALAAASFPLAAHAQAAKGVRRVGLLMSTTPAAASHIVVAFVDALRELGHTDGKDVVFEQRWAESHPERFAELAADLVRQRMDVIVASSQAAALAVMRATEATSPGSLSSSRRRYEPSSCSSSRRRSRGSRGSPCFGVPPRPSA